MISIKHLAGRNLVKIVNNNTFTSNAKIRGSIIKLYGNNNSITIAPGTKIRNCKILIYGENNNLTIEKNCDINNTVFSMDNGNGKIKIDEGTSIGKALIVSYEPNTIDIGKNCMLSYDIEIRNTDSHSIISLDNGERINKGKDVIIRDNVWIGAYSKVLKGSIISEHSVIGMSSVVTGNIPENSVAAGNPAKILRNNITWNKELL